jgi:hypothetical protein
MVEQASGTGDAVCSGAGMASVAAEELLKVLPPEVSPALRDAIASGCCIHYTVAEGMCGSGGCGTGSCCYHAVGAACGIDKYECLPYPCSKGDFSTGC